MKYGKYYFRSVIESDILFNQYKGSVLRGAFGFGLRKAICPIKKGYCKECLLKTECLYIKIFEPSLLSLQKEGSVPNPFVIEPPIDQNIIMRAGSDFNFNIIIFGSFNKYLPYFIYAIENAGKNGIGGRLFQERGKLRLHSVTSEDTLVYLAEGEKLHLIDDPPELGISFDHIENIRRIKVDFITPFRMKYQNRFNSDTDFHILAGGMIRRAIALTERYGDNSLNIDYYDMIRKAEAVKTVESDITWEDLSRYSGTQKQRMLFGGIKGSVIYEGELGEFIPLIKFCEKTHAGKQSAFGLGKIKFSIVE